MLSLLIGTSVFAANPSPDILRSDDTKSVASYRFLGADEKLLDDVQRGCFEYLWHEVRPPAYVVKDRKKAPVASVAAVGFQLSAIPIGVERGWITRDEGETRALAILDALLGRDDNRHEGIFLHFVDLETAGLSTTAYEVLASTIDTSLLLPGAMTVSEYFGGKVRERADQMLREANWRAFVDKASGLVCMGWRPDDRSKMNGSGKYHKSLWQLSSAEEHLVYWLAIGSPVEAHAADPKSYYKLRREIKQHGDMQPYVVSWSGTLFHYFFDHCWIDYRSLAADNPKEFGVDAPRVDWFENSRRAVLTHRQRCIEAAKQFKTFGPNVWGQSACDGPDGYAVPHVGPNISNDDKWFGGIVAPYAAASAIMFTPEESMAAIREMRSLKDENGNPLIWRDPAKGGYGFADSFNLDRGFVSDDYVGIDEGPMILAIENARTGLIWRLFMQHPASQRAVGRLKLSKAADR
ncbi:MAG TPA: glucoamylase family protein [Phycisphaerae bacterium]|nr:glucoamylase family protein [Phycisphaerae bacterium]